MLVLCDFRWLLPAEPVEEPVLGHIGVVVLVECGAQGGLIGRVSPVSLDLYEGKRGVAQLEDGTPLGEPALGALAVDPLGSVEALDQVVIAVVAQCVASDFAVLLDGNDEAPIGGQGGVVDDEIPVGEQAAAVKNCRVDHGAEDVSDLPVERSVIAGQDA